jgi:hypothetical protein
MQLFIHIIFIAYLSPLVQAQFPPPPRGVMTVKAKDNSGASLSYKQSLPDDFLYHI